MPFRAPCVTSLGSIRCGMLNGRAPPLFSPAASDRLRERASLIHFFHARDGCIYPPTCGYSSGVFRCRTNQYADPAVPMERLLTHEKCSLAATNICVTMGAFHFCFLRMVEEETHGLYLGSVQCLQRKSATRIFQEQHKHG